jgi:tetratricopeptide (TPR) repeat protein
VVSAIALAVALASAAPEAWGQSAAPAQDLASARARFERGQRLFKVSRYREALEEFKEAYLAKPDPVFLYNIAQCHRLLGERGDAIMFYRRYLEAAPGSRNRPEVERRIADLEEANRAAATVSPPPVVAPVLVNAPPPPPAAAPEKAVMGEVSDERPVYRRWWLWTGVGAAVAAGAVTAVLLSRSGPSGCGPNLDLCHKL